ncbi:MAG: hypothetical protein LBV12_01905 [Puniceicoccales bacterium]|jgi:hypothetical protein|nr:hypothetical protein [Puniceicoccales bacterium]
MSVIFGKNDWKRLEQECSQAAEKFSMRAGDGADLVGLTAALAAELRDAGWIVRENVIRPARHKDCLVGEYVCPILINEQAVILVTDVLPYEVLSRERLRNVRESVGLAAAIMVSRGGGIASDYDDASFS